MIPTNAAGGQQPPSNGERTPKEDERTPGLELFPVSLAQPWSGLSRLDIGPYKIGIAITNEDGHQDPEAAGAALESWVTACNSFTGLREALANLSEKTRHLVDAVEIEDTTSNYCKARALAASACLEEARAALNGVTQPAISTATNDVLAERERQKTVEGWTPAHDDTHSNFEMARAAAFYALHTAADVMPEPSPEMPSDRYGLFLTADQAWPPQWDRILWKKPKGARRNLVRAAALLIAEIERLDRAEVEKLSTDTEVRG